MLKIILVNGLMAAVIIAGVSNLLVWLAGDDAAHSHSAWLGYLAMVVGFSFIFVAIKQHRDKNLGGVLYFSQAFKVGLLVSLIASYTKFYFRALIRLMEILPVGLIITLLSAFLLKTQWKKKT